MLLNYLHYQISFLIFINNIYLILIVLENIMPVIDNHHDLIVRTCDYG